MKINKMRLKHVERAIRAAGSASHVRPADPARAIPEATFACPDTGSAHLRRLLARRDELTKATA